MSFSPGPGLRVDIHTHIIPKDLPDFARLFEQPGYIRVEHYKPCAARMMVGDTVFREITSNCWDPQLRLKECDNHGVTVQVLSTIPVLFYYWAKPAQCHDTSRFLNDHIATIVNQFPDRFIGLGTVPLQDPELAILELTRCVKDLNFRGVQIGSHVGNWNLSEPALFPFFQAAEQLGAAVFVHPWDMMGKNEMTKYWLPWLVGMPAETSRAICSVIFGGVLERLPRLRIGFAHGGGSFPATIGRIEHGFKVRPDLCAVDNNQNPRKYLGRFYVDSLVHDPDALLYLLNLIGPKHIMLGSDYPFPLGEESPGAMIESMDLLTDEIKDQLFWKSALDFLALI